MHGTRRAAALTAAALTASSLLLAQGPANADATPLGASTPGATRGADIGQRVRAATTWFAAPSLVALRNEVDARWPSRDRSSDGTAGDYSHSLSYSEHNPVGTRNGPRFGTRGAVHAIDITARGIDVPTLLAGVLGDSRVQYVIHAGRIYSAWNGFIARPYSGGSHSSHIHVSLRNDSPAVALASERDTRPWLTSPAPRAGVYGLAPGASGPRVVALQRALIARGHSIPAGPTGTFGNQTRAAVRAFQHAQGWSGSNADGIPGPTTLRLLGLSGAVVVASGSGVTVSGRPSVATAAAGTRSRIVPGARGPQVVRLQQALIARGFTIPSGATGFFGPQTKRAVRKFQRAQGWRGPAADGVPGPTSLRVLGLR